MLEPEKKIELALKGIACVLTVDSLSNELTDLYVRDRSVWKHLIDRFSGNKMMVTLRGPFDYKRELQIPSDVMIDKLKIWLDTDGTLTGIKDIVKELTQ